MGHPVAFAKLAELDREDWGISSLVLAELQFGLSIDRLRPDSRRALELFLRTAAVLPFETDAALAAAEVRAQLANIGKPAGAIDQLLAGHAIALGAVLVTENLKHFEHVPRLLVESWL